MERSWKKITVLPVGHNTTPWLEDEAWRQALTLVLERMEENQRRWLMGLLSLQLGRGGQLRLAEITGMEPDTIRAGQRDLASGLEDCPDGRTRREGAGRRALTEQDPTLERDLDALIRDRIAGNPNSGDTWVRSTLRELQKALNKQGHAISHTTVRELLKKRGIRCRPTASVSPVRPTRTATRSSSTSRRRRKSS
jgi:hypothetical protein